MNPWLSVVDRIARKPLGGIQGLLVYYVHCCPVLRNREAEMKLLVKDAARLLDVSDKTIYRWIKQGSIPAYKLNEQYRFNRAELLEWATARRISISPEIFREEESEAHECCSRAYFRISCRRLFKSL